MLKIITLVLLIFILPISPLEAKNMEVVKGLAPAMAEFNESEKKLITQVAARLTENGFPIEEVTRIHLSNRMQNQRDYYADNKVVFIINPAVYKFSQNGNNIEEISVRWEDSTVVYNPDGSMEFIVGRKVSVDDLVLTLYGLQDQYLGNKPLGSPDTIINKISDVFILNRRSVIKAMPYEGLLTDSERADEKIQKAISHNIEEIIKNHLVVIHERNNNGEYDITISRIATDVVKEQSDYQAGELDVVYQLKINLVTAEITLLNDYYPGFFPTPIPQTSIELPGINDDFFPEVDE